MTLIKTNHNPRMLYKSVKCIDKQITSLHSLNIKLKYYNDLNYIEIQLSKY